MAIAHKMPYKNQTSITITKETKEYIEKNLSEHTIIDRTGCWDKLLLELTKYYLENKK